MAGREIITDGTMNFRVYVNGLDADEVDYYGFQIYGSNISAFTSGLFGQSFNNVYTQNFDTEIATENGFIYSKTALLSYGTTSSIIKYFTGLKRKKI